MYDILGTVLKACRKTGRGVKDVVTDVAKRALLKMKDDMAGWSMLGKELIRHLLEVNCIVEGMSRAKSLLPLYVTTAGKGLWKHSNAM
jgi:hypothetical protein